MVIYLGKARLMFTSHQRISCGSAPSFLSVGLSVVILYQLPHQRIVHDDVWYEPESCISEVQRINSFIECLFGEMARVTGTNQNLIIEYREVEGKSKTGVLGEIQ